MSVREVFGERRTAVQLVAAADAHAVTGFYDARAPRVREHRAGLCAADRVHEATLAAFIESRAVRVRRGIGGLVGAARWLATWTRRR